MPSETTPGTTFPVSSVSLASELLPEVPRDRAIEWLLFGPLANREKQLRADLARSHWGNWRTGIEQELARLLGVKEHSIQELGALSCRCEHLVGGVLMHPVLVLLFLAFDQHRPIRLVPDAIWLLICQGVGRHIEANAERFRSQFVAHEGKAKIEVRRDWFVRDFTKNDWEHVIEELVAVVHSQIGPHSGLFEPRFSTT